MSIPSVLVLPCPAPGHINPLMSFSEKVVEHGCKIIFVNTDFAQKRVMSSMAEQLSLNESPIEFVSIPDGLGPEDDRTDLGELSISVLNTMPAALEKLIEDIDLNGDHRISYIVADMTMGWAMQVASKLKIKGAAFWPASATMFALADNIPMLIDNGIIDSDDEHGLVSREEIKKKVDQLLSDENIRSRSLKVKEMVMSSIAEGGRSSENFSRFV